MISIDKLIGNDDVFRVESPADIDRGFVVTHKKTGLWIECYQDLDINQAKQKLNDYIKGIEMDEFICSKCNRPGTKVKHASICVECRSAGQRADYRKKRKAMLDNDTFIVDPKERAMWDFVYAKW